MHRPVLTNNPHRYIHSRSQQTPRRMAEQTCIQHLESIVWFKKKKSWGSFYKRVKCIFI